MHIFHSITHSTPCIPQTICLQQCSDVKMSKMINSIVFLRLFSKNCIGLLTAWGMYCRSVTVIFFHGMLDAGHSGHLVLFPVWPHGYGVFSLLLWINTVTMSKKSIMSLTVTVTRWLSHGCQAKWIEAISSIVERFDNSSSANEDLPEATIDEGLVVD